ncbi:GlyGly-CTERM sorting domain-containing protein [Vibrio agarivorans]|uniref:GlyGly-CTERM sorting domain-containing protein n=1 Tax=Vibrio agarivorans TaxID=153622 RepID=UPI00222F68BF|nr:GlyGly-CTERM sorting domain-containing protein [Vibrio agarivorans]
MKKMQTVAVLAASLMSAGVMADEYRTPVAAEDYTDNVVHLSIPVGSYSSNKCGGMLLGSKYIMTATHCTWRNNGEPITIKQGLSRSEPDASYERQVVEIKEAIYNREYVEYLKLYIDYYLNDVKGSILNEMGEDVVEPEYVFKDFDTYDAVVAQDPDDKLSSSIQRDLAILVLDEGVPYASSAVIKPNFEYGSEETLYDIGESFTFRGWGTLGSTGATSNVMMQFELELERMTHQPYMMVEVEGDQNSMGDQLRIPLPCKETADSCFYSPQYKNTFYNPLQSVTDGDSGTPLIKDGNVIGVVSTNSLENQDGLRARSDFVTFDSYMNWFVRTIDEVTYPTNLTLDVHTESDVTFDVQNFTASDVDSVLTSGEYVNGVFVYTDCGVIESTSACSVEITAPDMTLMPGEELEVDIQLSSEIFIPVTLYSTEYKIVEPGDPTPPTDPIDPIDPTDPINPDNGTDKGDEEEETDIEIGEKPTDPDEGNGNGGDGTTDPDEGNGNGGDGTTDPDEGNGGDTDEGSSNQGGGSGGSMGLFTILGLIGLAIRKKFVA